MICTFSGGQGRNSAGRGMGRPGETSQGGCVLFAFANCSKGLGFQCALRLAFHGSSLLVPPKLMSLKDSHPQRGGRRQPLLSKIRASIWSTRQDPICSVLRLLSSHHLCATHLLLKTVTQCSVASGSLESPRGEFRSCGVCTLFFFWPSEAEQRSPLKISF